MYGWLESSIKEDGIQIQSIRPDWDIVELLSCVTADRRSPDRQAKVVELSGLPADDPQLIGDLTVRSIALLVGDEQLEYASLMFAAHYRLPEQHKSQREALIDQVIQQHIGAGEKTGPFRVPLIRGLARILPDASIATNVSAWLTNALASLGLVNKTTFEMPPGFTRLMACLQQQSAWLKTMPYRLTSTLVLASRSEAQCDQWLAVLPRLSQSNPEAVQAAMGAYHTHVLHRERAMRNGYGINALARVLETTPPDAPVEAWRERISLELRQAEMDSVAEDMQICLASINAVSAGINLGRYTNSSRQAVADYERYWLAPRTQVNEAAQRLARRAALPASALDAGSAEGLIDKASLQSWSVDQLVAWIDGPLSSPTSNTDPKQIIERARQTRRRAAAISPSQPSPTAPITDDTDDDLDPQAAEQLVRDALANTANFFLGEIEDLWSMAEQTAFSNEVNVRVKKTCDELREPLNVIKKNPKLLTETETRQELHEAEIRIQALRQDINNASRQIALDRHFIQALGTALKNEALVLGKKTGGTIACPVAYDQWQAISDSFHQRWLPNARRILVNNVTIELQPDQALALYVTGSSQSGYAFDVSVHLWRRRPDCQSLPSEKTGAYPPINTADWFDTYQTCCVLHVPHARQN